MVANPPFQLMQVSYEFNYVPPTGSIRAIPMSSVIHQTSPRPTARVQIIPIEIDQSALQLPKAAQLPEQQVTITEWQQERRARHHLLHLGARSHRLHYQWRGQTSALRVSPAINFGIVPPRSFIPRFLFWGVPDQRAVPKALDEIFQRLYYRGICLY